MNATVLDINAFYNQFPKFKVKFTEDRVEYWLTQFQTLYDKNRFGQLWERASCLYTAHNLVIEDKLSDPEEAFTIASGPATVINKEVGPLHKSVSYSAKFTQLPQQGQWGLTLYGQQFFQIVRQVGIGGQLIGPSSNQKSQKGFY